MLKDPKVIIQKKKILNEKNNFRYYSANGKGNPSPKLYLDLEPNINTEKDLVEFIYNNWGEGEYLVIGYAKGVKGCWTFWKGKITKEGFIFLPKTYSKKEKNYWDKQIREEDDPEEIENLKEVRDQEIQQIKEKAKKRRYGFKPFLKKSSNRGEFRFWDDDNLVLKNDEDEEQDKRKWSLENKEKNKLPNWGNPPQKSNLPKW